MPQASTESGPASDILAGVAYEVRTDVYEGPFDVLLRLITEQRVELFDVRLSDIVDAFLAEIDKLERVDLEMATEFLLIAAILLELKSRRLLPDRDGAIGEDDLAFLEEHIAEHETTALPLLAIMTAEQAKADSASEKNKPRRSRPSDETNSSEKGDPA